jgi:hypothetical protein
LRKEFEEILEVVESTLPMDALFADLGGQPDKVGGSMVSDETLSHAVAVTVAQLRESGLRMAEIRQMLPFAEPFRSNWERAESMIDQMSVEGKEHVGERCQS